MKTGNRSNALLVELLIVVMFFMLAATVLLKVFSGAASQGNRAGMTIEAMNGAQNVAESLYSAEDPEKALREMGFALDGGVWSRNDGDFVIEAVTQKTDRAHGVWYGQEVRVIAEGERMFTLPCSRYEEARP